MTYCIDKNTNLKPFGDAGKSCDTAPLPVDVEYCTYSVLLVYTDSAGFVDRPWCWRWRWRWGWLGCGGLHHRRIKNTEEKVVAAVWGTVFIQFLAALAVFNSDDLKNRMNCTRMI